MRKCDKAGMIKISLGGFLKGLVAMAMETFTDCALLEQLQGAAIYWENELEKYDAVLLLVEEEHFNLRVQKAFESKLENRRIKVVCGEQANALLKLYTLYSFTDKLIIGSFDKPYGRKLHHLIASGIATEEELISDVLLGMV